MLAIAIYMLNVREYARIAFASMEKRDRMMTRQSRFHTVTTQKQSATDKKYVHSIGNYVKKNMTQTLCLWQGLRQIVIFDKV